MKHEEKRRRVKLLCIPDHDIVNVFSAIPNGRDYLCLPMFPALPEGYEVLGVQHSFERGSMMLLIHHPTFDAVEPGVEAPAIASTMEMRETTYRREKSYSEAREGLLRDAARSSAAHLDKIILNGVAASAPQKANEIDGSSPYVTLEFDRDGLPKMSSDEELRTHFMAAGARVAQRLARREDEAICQAMARMQLAPASEAKPMPNDGRTPTSQKKSWEFLGPPL